MVLSIWQQLLAVGDEAVGVETGWLLHAMGKLHLAT